MNKKMLVIVMVALLAVGTIGGLAFAIGSNPDSTGVPQEKAQVKQVSLAESLITENSSSESMVVEDLPASNNSTSMPEVVNNEQFIQMQDYMNNLTSEGFDQMLDLMGENGLQNMYEYMQEGNLKGMNQFMNNLTEEDFQKMIDLMGENGFGYMSQMMDAVGYEGMVEMHDSMMGNNGSGSNMMNGFRR